MARITSHDVDKIIDVEIGETELSTFIEDAHRVVENRISEYTSDEDALASVEAYLAAHFATATEPAIASVSHESVSIDYESDSSSSEYWHKAILLDPTDRLSRPNGYPVYSIK